MPLDWEHVKNTYRNGALVPFIAGGKKFKVTKVTDDAVFVSTPANPNAPIKRENLERMVMLIETKRVSTDLATLTDDYRTLVEDNRATSAVSILKDLGYIK